MIPKCKSTDTSNFTRAYCYHCSILLWVIITNLLLCLIYKLNFIIGIACTGKNIVYIWFSIIQFQKFTVGLGFLWTKESTKYPTASVTSALWYLMNIKLNMTKLNSYLLPKFTFPTSIPFQLFRPKTMKLPLMPLSHSQSKSIKKSC
jgi:hypothetical protein